jgi:hypothetical protein
MMSQFRSKTTQRCHIIAPFLNLMLPLRKNLQSLPSYPSLFCVEMPNHFHATLAFRHSQITLTYRLRLRLQLNLVLLAKHVLCLTCLSLSRSMNLSLCLDSQPKSCLRIRLSAFAKGHDRRLEPPVVIDLRRRLEPQLARAFLFVSRFCFIPPERFEL